MRVVILTVVLATVLGTDAKQSARTKRNACTGVPDGTFVADDTSCSNFFVCYNGEAVVQSCNQGSYFDTNNSYCSPDTQDICPQARPQCTTDGEFSPHPTECSQFYICSEGKLVKQSCLPGSYFDTTNLYCIPDTDKVCQQPPECSENGAYSPHLTNCWMFYICYNGELVEQSCEPGSYFNKTNLYCVPDTNNECQVAECTEEGEFVPHPTQCDLFYVCYNGQLVEQTCGSGSYFDKKNLYCMPDSENTCRPLTPSTAAPCTCVGGYTSGQFIANPDSCYLYYVCSGGQLLEQNCGNGNYFDNDTKVCERDKDGSCWPGAETTSATTTAAASSCSCPGGYEEGDFVSNADSCHSYFICSQGKLNAQSCGPGNYFNASSKTCARDENGSCWPTTTSTTTTAPAPCQCAGGYGEGELVANSDSCHSYFVCTQGQLIAQSCGTGNYFDESTKSCARDENGSCWPTTTSTTTTAPAPCQCAGGYEEGALVANSDSCHSYFICTQGQLIAQSCGTGNYFDESSKNCARDENGSCWPSTTSTTTTAPAPCQCAGGFGEGDLVANSDSCHSYFICTQGQLIAQSCGTGNYFDESSKNCVRDENGSCWPTTTSTTTTAPAPCQCAGGYGEGDLVANSDSCHSFFVCTQGQLIAQSCGTGNYFDESSKNCARDENGSCWPTTTSTTTTAPAPCQCPGGYGEGDLVANSDNCSSYFICSQGKLVEQDCGSGNYFDATSKNCIYDVNGICIPTTEKPFTCPDGYEDGELIPLPGSCFKFNICFNGELLEESCHQGNYFDSVSKSCVVDETGVCWPIISTPFTPSTSKTTKSTLTPSTASTSSTTPPSTESSTATSSTTAPSSKSTTLTTPSATSTSSKTPPSTEPSTAIPSTITPSSESTSPKTPSPTTDAPCSCAGGYEDGELIPYDGSCFKFNICFNGELVEESCHEGNYFDIISKSCVVDETGVCWPIISTPSTPSTSKTTKSTLTPSTALTSSTTPPSTESSTATSSTTAPSSKSTTLTTPSATSTSSKTPPSTEPSTAIASTIKPSSESTSPKTPSPTTEVPCSCAGGYEDGELIPYDGSCFKFNICFNGELVEESCHEGNYFDIISKSCVVDETGVCWPIISTPSTPSTSKTTKTTLTPSTASTSSTTPPSTESSTATSSTTAPSSKSTTLTTPSATSTSSKTPPSTEPSTAIASTITPSSESTSPKTPSPTTDVPCSCAGGYEDGELIPYDGSCFKFNICFNGELVEESCHEGNYFDIISKSCVVDETGVCWPIISTPSTPSTSKTTKTTHTPSTASTSSTTPSTATPSTTTTSTSSTSLSTTPSSTTPSTKKPSTTTEAPSYNCTGGYVEGELVAYPGSCDKYYICYSGELLPKSCGKGTYFDAISQSCVIDETGVCAPISSTPSTTSTSKTSESTLTPSTASTSTITPTSTTPSSTKPSTATPSTTTTSTSSTSLSTTPSSTTISTKKPSTTTEAPSYNCTGGYVEGELVAYPGSCDKYYICYSGELLPKSCGKGTYFDAISQSCVIDETGVCAPIRSTTSTSKTSESTLTPSTASTSTTTPTSTTPSSTKPSTSTPSTTKSTATSTSESSSPTTLSSTTDVPCSCPGGYDQGEFVPYPGNCYKFYICFNGELIEESCGSGNYFNSTSKSCFLDKSGECWPIGSTPSTTTEADTTNSTTSSSSSTPSSTKSSSTTPSTTADSTTKKFTTTEAPCTCPGGYGDGEFLPHPDSCYLFKVCYQGELVEVSCGFGNYFDNITKSCVLDTTGICWSRTTSVPTTASTSSAPRTCAGGYEDGDFVPNPNSCSGFYICYEGELNEMSCETGNYFNASTKSCALDTTGICWPKPTSTTTAAPRPCPNGYQNGQIIPNPTACYMYYICIDGDLIEGNCGTGNYFNNATNACDADTGGCCWPSLGCPNGLQQGQFIANPSSCNLYNVCHNGQLLEGNCGTGNYFNSATSVCETDSSGNCSQWNPPSQPQPPSDGCNGLQEGQFSSSPSACYLYNICHNGQLLQGYCGTGNYFNAATNACEADSSGNCSQWNPPSQPQPPPNGCNGLQEGQFSSSPSACYLYNVCYNGQLVEGNCGTGNFFNSATNVCEADSSGNCSQWNPPSQPQPPPNVCNGLQEGQFSSNPSACYLYNICHNGQLLQGYCGTGNYFNAATNACEADSSGNCSQWNPPSQPQPPPNGCNGLQEGQFSSSPSACFLYNVCYNGQLVEGNCGTGNFFNSATNVCETDSSGNCCQSQPPSSGCSNGMQEGQFTPNPSSCYLYNICYNGQLLQGTCGTGNYFNSSTNTCNVDTAGYCWPLNPPVVPEPEPCGCSNGLQEGQFTSNPSSCYLYSVCQNGELIEGNCGIGNYFNNVSKICETDTGGCCWPTNAKCPGGYANGDFVPDSSQCDKFFICYEGALIPQDCGVGYFFDNLNNYCTRDINETCWAVPTPNNTCDGVADGTFIINETSCDKYSVCYNNTKIGQECGTGNYFNSETLTCVRDTLGTCWKKVPNVCANSPTGTFVANPSNCQEFYVCYQNRAVLQQCTDGNWFNPQLSVCQPDLAATCVNVCRDTRATLSLPHPQCNQFYLCANGLTTRVGTCSRGTNFNETLGICLSSTICEADLCAQSGDGVVYPVQSDLASFYLCENRIPVKHSCPDGASFDPERLICIPDTGRCIGQKNGFAVASYNNPNAYYVCKDNMAIFAQCPSYAIFDAKSNICVQIDRRRFSNNKCTAEPDGTMLPGDACNEYHLCLDGEDIAQNCGAYSSFNKKLGHCTFNLTCFNEAELCAKSSDTVSFPDARYENVFYKCKRGLAVKEKCPKNMVYSHDIGYCVPKELAMSSEELDQLCENVSDNTMAPAMDCRKFYICSNNVPILQQCASDQHFSVMTGTCLPDVERECWIRSETLRGSSFIKTVCHEGHVRDHATDCDRYEICTDGVWTAELCPARHLFDSASQVCVPGDAGQMCPSTRSSECSDEMPLRASENACTDYYRCENNHWSAAKCPNGEFFSGKMATCTNDISECARSQKIKSVGEKNCVANETKADELNCGLFHVCHEGEWWYRFCDEGSYFNRSLSVCTPNDGTCRSVSVPGPCRNGTVKKSDYDPCIVYHLCVDGNWTTQHCPAEHYFDETRKACMLDDGQRKCQNDIENASSLCKDGDRRYHSSNCNAFDICSFGNWLSVTCRSQFYFDTSLKICMPNRGECSVNGLLRQVCVENTSHQGPGNCSEFYYCSRGKWQLESCLEGFQYNATIDKCIPAKSGCETDNTSDWMKDRCAGLTSGSSVAHEFDCTKYYLCVDDLTVEANCSAGRFFDSESKYCELNNGACPLKMATDENICQGISNGSHVQNPANCTTFYICTDTLSLLSYCPPEQYFNAEIGACQFDTGICNKPRLCDSNPTGRLPHETYCNIYYTCVRGMAIPVACEEDHIFDPTTKNCIIDTEHRCVDGILVGDEICAQGDDGRPLADSDDCKKYVMCTNGIAQTLQCPPGNFFDSNVKKCKPDNGTCPFVDGPDLPKNNTIPPDPITCIGKHGYLMPDPEHCNEWYVCIYGNLRHERCFDGEFFDLNTYSCSPMVDEEKCPTAGEMTTMCINMEEETSFADRTDCRKYYQCNDGELQSKKCRNGESFDTLLGFCRQNDGTCLLENGQRVGACAGKHGKLAADSENCRSYFTCINGQKISEECDHSEYFVKATSRCEKDVNSTCRPNDVELTNATQLSCDGLNELVFYPNVVDGCRTFFQCVKETPRVHKCPDDLLFNGKTGICDWKDYVQCIDMSQHYQIDKVCLNAINGTRYGSSKDNCDSYFICNDGKMKTFKCDPGHKYNAHSEKCDLAANVNCTMTD